MKKTMILFLAVLLTAALDGNAKSKDPHIEAFYKYLGSKIHYPEQAKQSVKYALITTFKLDGSNAPIKNENEAATAEYTELKLTIVAFGSAKQTVSEVRVQGYGNKSFKVSNQGNGIVVRGQNLINEPKVIIDSTEVSYSEMKTMDPNQIQTIQIFKGESAISAYGPEAINGVIVITTKKTENKPIPKKQD
jgi:TonB-dependent SusC/RagA subfamily outer membrane receptor